MDNATTQKVRDAIGKSDSVGIVVGPEPTIDSMGAGLALYLLLQEANKKVSIACPTEPIVELSSLIGIDKVQPGLGGDAGDLVVSFPYNEGEIDKVSYTVEDGYLNIIVKAGENGISFDDQDIRYSKGSGPVDLLFVIGASRLDDIHDTFDSEKLRETRIINIDNQEGNQGFGDIVLVSSHYSSISEQIADLALSLGMNIDQDVAQNLLNGITTATNNFQNPDSSPLAFEMASLLLKKGAQRKQKRYQRDEIRNMQLNTQNRPQQQQQSQRQESQLQLDSRRDKKHQDQNVQKRSGNRQPQDQRHYEERQKQNLQTQLRQEEAKNFHTTNETQQNPPDDSWLKPKVYKSSSNFEG